MRVDRANNRPAYTLIELVIAAGASSLLVGGLCSVVFLAGRALDEGSSNAVETSKAAEALDDTSFEWHHASGFSERADRAVTYKLPDRDADGLDETVRLSWSGTAGDPLQSVRNGGALADLAVDVREFRLAYSTRPVVGTGFAKGWIGDESLVAHWTFDEGSGAVANDATANANHGTLVNGPTWTADRLGQGLQFDGTNDYVTVPHKAALTMSDEMTLAAWIWAPNNAYSGFRVILNKGTSAYSYALATYNTEVGFGFYNGNLYGILTSGAGLVQRRWYHVAATWKREAPNYRMRLYLDGTQRVNQTTSVGLLPNTQALTIGREVNGSYWRGILDDVRIYNRALSGTEILQLKNGEL